MHYHDLDNNALLTALDKARNRFVWDQDQVEIKSMIDALIARGVYPAVTVEGNPNDVYTMVTGYGARWHEWREPHACPHCKADLRDYRTGPPYKREIGLYDRDTDRTVSVICPDCKRG
jgi:hypothetical protein